MNSTIDFYNRFSDDYFSETINLDMTDSYTLFEKYVKGNYLLDLGCGSGRDSKYFLSKGYKVTSVDGSLGMCKLAQKLLGQPVLCRTFSEISNLVDFDGFWKSKFNGVWASASLLHLHRDELNSAFTLLWKLLKIEGCAFVSFKKGNFEGKVDGRYFTYIDYDDLFALCDGLFEIKHIFTSNDLRPNNICKWLNAVLIKCV